MLTSIKDKLITNVNRISLLSPTLNPENEKQTSVDLNIGAEVLTYFQKSWAELHELNEYNARNAALIADRINAVHEKISKDHSNITKIARLLEMPPVINKSLHNCLSQMKSLQDSFQSIEKGLTDLEIIIDEQDLRKTKSHYINSLLSEHKNEIANKMAKSIIDEQHKQQKISEERQQVFAEAFNEDIQTYKTFGAIPKIESKVQPSALLEEIQLDLDQQDLETFLSDK